MATARPLIGLSMSLSLAEPLWTPRAMVCKVRHGPAQTGVGGERTQERLGGDQLIERLLNLVQRQQQQAFPIPRTVPRQAGPRSG